MKACSDPVVRKVMVWANPSRIRESQNEIARLVEHAFGLVGEKHISVKQFAEGDAIKSSFPKQMYL